MTNPMGTRYPSETRRVRVQISTRSLFIDGRVTALPDPNLTRCHPYGGEVEDDWRSRAIGGPFFRHASDHPLVQNKTDTQTRLSEGWVWLQPGCKIKATAAPIGCETYV
jgi:hypothetical protein